MKRVRIWFWRSIRDLFRLGVHWAHMRAAKACGCDNCRLHYDPASQAAFVRGFAELWGGAPAGDSKKDERPS